MQFLNVGVEETQKPQAEAVALVQDELSTQFPEIVQFVRAGEERTLHNPPPE